MVRIALAYGVARAELSSLTLGLAASFMMLAGAAAFISGRVLVAVASGSRSSELALWKLLAVVAVVAGIATVFFGYRSSLPHPLPSLDEVAFGLAGSFVLMVGILALMAQRVMRQLNRKSSPLADRPTDEFPAAEAKK